MSLFGVGGGISHDLLKKKNQQHTHTHKATAGQMKGLIGQEWGGVGVDRGVMEK